MKAAETIKNTSGKRELSLDAMRIFSIFFVIFAHTGINGYTRYCLYPEDSIHFWLYMFLTIMCQASIPLFVFISGALMLHRRPEPISVILKTKASRFLVVLVVVSVIYYCYGIHTAGEVFSWSDLLTQMYATQTRAFLWYLYAYLAYLLGLPFLQTLCQHLETKYFYYMFAVCCILDGIVPMMQYLIWRDGIFMNPEFQPIFTMDFVLVYPCLGYFLEHRISPEQMKKALIPMWVLNLVGFAAIMLMTCYRGRIMGGYSPDLSGKFFGCFVILDAVTIFITFKVLFKTARIPECVGKMIASVSKNTFGMYLLFTWLVHLECINRVRELLVQAGCNSMLACFAQCFCVMVVSYGITFIMKKIPVIKNYL